MKRILNLIGFVGLVGALVTYSSCGSTPEPELPQADQQLQKLLGTTARSGAATLDWSCTSATLDGVDKTANYTSAFTITLSGEIAKTLAAGATASFNYTTAKPTYVASESPFSPWPKTGKFTFDKDAPATKVTRDDATAIQYSVSETELVMNFSFTGNGVDRSGGRTEVVKGAWIFKFKKK